MDPQLNERKGQKLGGASVADVSDKTNEDASPPGSSFSTQVLFVYIHVLGNYTPRSYAGLDLSVLVSAAACYSISEMTLNYSGPCSAC